MSGAEKIAISAAIGGTAEALGGGKFANGVVNGLGDGLHIGYGIFETNTRVFQLKDLLDFFGN